MVAAPLRAARLAARTLVIMPPVPGRAAGAAGHGLELGVAHPWLRDQLAFGSPRVLV